MGHYSYTTEDPVSKFALVDWRFESFSMCKTFVLPDGCKDFIFNDYGERSGSWFMSDLTQAPYSVSTQAASIMYGIRLQPGVEIRLAHLSSWLRRRDPTLLLGTDLIDEFCVKNENLTEALDCLASGKPTVLAVASEIGVSLRSLQRLVKTGTGQTPYFWFSLARIRKAGRWLLDDKKLCDIAVGMGFSDQAHMNREMKIWFGKTPNQIKSDPEFLHAIAEPGYG